MRPTRLHDYADPELPSMYLCDFLEREDVGMTGKFVIEAA